MGITGKLKNIARALKIWNKDHFGHTQANIRSIEEKLLLLQNSGDGEKGKQMKLDEELRNQRAILESVF